MTPYLYEAADGLLVERSFDMGHAPRELLDHDLGLLKRSFGSVAWQFPWGGRESFKGATLRERQERQMAECAADGVVAEPVGSRWV